MQREMRYAKGKTCAMHLTYPKVMGEGQILAAGQACESLSKSPVRLCHLSPEQRLNDILK